jgi:hypothetical protein
MTKEATRGVRLGAILCLTLTACQSYRPVALGDIRQGDRLRVTANPAVPVRLREITIERATRVDGEAVTVQNGELVLSAMWVERDGGAGTLGEGWTVTVPVASLQAVAERRFSMWRTAVVVVGGAVASLAGWSAFGGGGGGDPGPGGGGGPPL